MFSKLAICVTGLAICDLLFCMVTLLSTYLTRERMVHEKRDLSVMLTLYGPYLMNLLLYRAGYM